MNDVSGDLMFLLAVGLAYLVFGVGVIGYSSRFAVRVPVRSSSRPERQK